MKKFIELTVALATLLIATSVPAAPVVIKSGNVIGPTLPHEIPHHLLQSQYDFAKLVKVETQGEVDLEILEGKREDIPPFRMPAMTTEGSVIQACAVPSFFLPLVPGMKIFEIPYLFRDRAQAARYPASDLAAQFSAQIEEKYQVKVLGHFLVANNVAITSTDRAIINPQDFAGRHVNDGFESFAPMWVNVKPATRYDISFQEAVDGALHKDALLDTSIGMVQNMYVQNQYTKFNYVTVAPSFYTFFYTFMMNKDVWDGLSESQQAGVLRAARAMQVAAFANEESTAIYHAALNQALGMEVHKQTDEERAAWAKEFSDKVRDGILQSSENPEQIRGYVKMIQDL